MDEATANALDNLAAKTGRSVPDWLQLARDSIPMGHRVAVEHLKSTYGIGHGYANTLMLVAKQDGATSDDLVEAQYAGPKAGLRPICDLLLSRATALGDDVEVAPKKTGVSLRRKKQFALITPATRDRIDLGINLPGAPADDRVVLAGGMCTHKIAVRAVAEVDTELERWLREAYDRAG